jgi:hypothetical protein
LKDYVEALRENTAAIERQARAAEKQTEQMGRLLEWLPMLNSISEVEKLRKVDLETTKALDAYRAKRKEARKLKGAAA